MAQAGQPPATPAQPHVCDAASADTSHSSPRFYCVEHPDGYLLDPSLAKGANGTLDPAHGDEGNSKDCASANLDLRHHLSALRKSKHLAILIGSGCSMRPFDDQSKQGGPSMGDLWTAVCEGTEKFEAICSTVHHNPSDDNIELLLSRAKMTLELTGDENVRTFIQGAENIIIKEVDFLKSDTGDTALPLSSHESLLRRYVRRAPQLSRTEVYTTNYDLCIETAAASASFVTIDGFSWIPPHQFAGANFDLDVVHRPVASESVNYHDKVFYYHKLHGSIGWKRSNDGPVYRTGKSSDGVLVYPASTKYQASYQQPFLEMIGRFQSFLRQPSTTLVTIGFGFNDDHLTEPILSALRSNPSFRLSAVAPGEKEKNQHFETLHQFIEQGDERVSRIGLRFDEFVRYLPDTDLRTGVDRLRERLDAIDNITTSPNDGEDG